MDEANIPFHIPNVNAVCYCGSNLRQYEESETWMCHGCFQTFDEEHMAECGNESFVCFAEDCSYREMCNASYTVCEICLDVEFYNDDDDDDESDGGTFLFKKLSLALKRISLVCAHIHSVRKSQTRNPRWFDVHRTLPEHRRTHQKDAD